jgi:hypothetical protein
MAYAAVMTVVKLGKVRRVKTLRITLGLGFGFQVRMRI